MFKDIPATFQIYCAKGQEKKRKSYVSWASKSSQK
jgi:hypothetical protein